ncbi:copper chaperone CopZ [Gracilibacillus salitolerans]|uniref:Copper chaperone CopZ n=1 Tax=Gracilibacillus salitolerans TaxID=2663022 RepID=A0A5Q2TNE9_9BACI|nr:copper chaperone CopZ [Gracilibacillus salitolerans]QGH35533.1 copper chaperone CopZ [Gracilibacillus salitolerans]
MAQTILKVQGMTCGHCKASVEGALLELAGVSKAEVNLEEGTVDVSYDETDVSIEAMHEAVEEQGYDIA